MNTIGYLVIMVAWVVIFVAYFDVIDRFLRRDRPKDRAAVIEATKASRLAMLHGVLKLPKGVHVEW